MKLHFLGAEREVTGSRYLLKGQKNILIDCGKEQGKDVYENAPMPIPAKEVDCVILTHAHIDHSGMLPLLVKNGFTGPIYATQATCDLAAIMLLDAAHIQESEIEWKNRKERRAGKKETEPVYNTTDAQEAIKLLVPCAYGTPREICGTSVMFFDAGHLLGSASVVIEADGETFLFSGDIGNTDQPLLKDPTYIEHADYVVMESTYGDRLHGDPEDTEHELAAVLNETFARGGSVIMPSFAVGRTQEMLYFVRKILDDKLTPYDFTVYVDSPLAIEATSVFIKNENCCYDAEARALLKEGINPIGFPGLKTSVTSEESKLINSDKSIKLIISASGMCEAGRIKHHLKHNLWNERNTVLFVGYQAAGTTGRAILDGAKKIKLFGEEIAVKAQVKKLDGVSSHADKDGLLTWIKQVQGVKQVFVTHGEETVSESFGALLNENGINAMVPYYGDVYDTAAGAIVTQGSRERKVPREAAVNFFEKLKQALERLKNIVYAHEHAPNGNTQQFADDIEALCDKWEAK